MAFSPTGGPESGRQQGRGSVATPRRATQRNRSTPPKPRTLSGRRRGPLERTSPPHRPATTGRLCLLCGTQCLRPPARGVSQPAPRRCDRHNERARKYCAGRFICPNRIVFPNGLFSRANLPISASVGRLTDVSRPAVSPPDWRARSVTAKKKAATVRPAAGRPGVKAKASAKAAKVPSPKRRTAGAGAAVAAPKSERAEAEVSIDRRRGPRRCDEGAPAPAAATAHVLEKRKKVNRRRQIDPTTCERDYSVD